MNKRNVQGQKIFDPAAVANNQYNDAAGAQKQVDVGPKLLPLKYLLVGVETYTTDATTARALPSIGRSVAVYNNANAVGAITFGQEGVTSQASGAVDSNGNPGIPCKPNDWTYLSAGDCTHVIASAATLLVFLIEDDSSLVRQSR